MERIELPGGQLWADIWSPLFNTASGRYPTQLKQTEYDAVEFVATEIVAGTGRLHPRKLQFEIATWYDPG